MNIVEKKIGQLTEYENNPRNNAKAIDAVAASIQEFGFKVPIVIDDAGVIVAGHTRYRAAQQLGLTTVPCIVADDLSDEQVRAFRLADNKTAELAEWDFEKLDEELELLGDMDMAAFGFTMLQDEGEMMEAINDSGMEETASHEYKMTFGSKVVIMTEDEYEDLLQKFDDYINEYGVSFGFVRWLLND